MSKWCTFQCLYLNHKFCSVGLDGWRVPSIRPLETLHNALTLKQVENLLLRVTEVPFTTPQSSPTNSRAGLHRSTQNVRFASELKLKTGRLRLERTAIMLSAIKAVSLGGGAWRQLTSKSPGFVLVDSAAFSFLFVCKVDQTVEQFVFLDWYNSVSRMYGWLMNVRRYYMNTICS